MFDLVIKENGEKNLDEDKAKFQFFQITDTLAQLHSKKFCQMNLQEEESRSRRKGGEEKEEEERRITGLAEERKPEGVQVLWSKKVMGQLKKEGSSRVCGRNQEEEGTGGFDHSEMAWNVSFFRTLMIHFKWCAELLCEICLLNTDDFSMQQDQPGQDAFYSYTKFLNLKNNENYKTMLNLIITQIFKGIYWVLIIFLITSNQL